MTTHVEIRKLPSEPDYSAAWGSSPVAMVLEDQGRYIVKATDELLMSSKFQIGCLRDGRLRVVEGFAVTWHAEAGEYVIEAAEINEFGFGRTLSEAIIDIQQAIAELYFALDREQDRLGPDLQAVRLTLTHKIRRADAPRSA